MNNSTVYFETILIILTRGSDWGLRNEFFTKFIKNGKKINIAVAHIMTGFSLLVDSNKSPNNPDAATPSAIQHVSNIIYLYFNKAFFMILTAKFRNVS